MGNPPTTINPELLTSAERLQYDGYVRREETNAAILKLASDGAPIKQIVRLTGGDVPFNFEILKGRRC